MSATVFFKSESPLYLQVAHTLKQEILDGARPIGSHLPSEEDLCEHFGVSRHTVREALRRLREDNLIASRQGACAVVVSRLPSDSCEGDVMSIDDLLTSAIGKPFDVQSIEMIEIDADIAARTGLAKGETWLAARVFGYMEGVECPVCWAEYFIHRKFAALGRHLPHHIGPVFPLLEDLFQQTIVSIHQEITATLITPILAHGLEVAAGSPALEVRRWYKTSDGQTAQVTISTHPASRFRHSMTMHRVRA